MADVKVGDRVRVRQHPMGTTGRVELIDLVAQKAWVKFETVGRAGERHLRWVELKDVELDGERRA